MTSTDPPEPRPELLAAYADGELDLAGCEVVERWLATHPEGAESLLAQHLVGPANTDLWLNAEPPDPAPRHWRAVRQAIHDALDPPVPHRGRWAAAGLLGAVVASAVAAVVWIIAGPAPAPVALQPVAQIQPVSPDLAPHTPKPPPIAAPDDPLADIPVLPMAGGTDVVITRVVGAESSLIVGEPPLAGPLVLAGEDDVETDASEFHPDWSGGGIPMLFASGPR